MKSGIFAVLFLFGCVLLFAVGYWLNFPGMHDLAKSIGDGINQFLHVVGLFVAVLVSCAALIGSAFLWIEWDKRRKITIIGPNRHGYKQAIVHNGQVIQLNQPNQTQMDPLQQLAALQKYMQVQARVVKEAHQTMVQEIVSTPLAIEAPAPRTLPKVEMFYELIKFNSLHTAMGIEAATGKPVLAPIVKSTHFKLIGGSGQGKSCVAAAILDIAIQTNDPDHLRIGLLDLEHNTSRLFEDVSHVAEIGPKRQRLVGRDPDEVAQKLKLLQWELSRRAQLGEEHCRAQEPVLLVYVEEMLSLKYEVIDKKLNTEMLAAINIIGIRGRKYGIFLLACMQSDYSDKSTREAMAQFRTRAGFAIDPDTARASGFFNTDLVNKNFKAGQPGQYVLEKPQFSGLVLSPDYDVALKLEQLAAPSQATTGVQPIRLYTVPREVETTLAEVDTEGECEAAPSEVLRSASSGFSAQEERIVRKFYQEGIGIGQIVSSEYINGKGEPLTGGEEYKRKSKEVQEVIRRFHSREVGA